MTGRPGDGNMIRRIHHVAVVVRRLERAYGFYRDTLRLPLLAEAAVPEQGVRAALLAAGETEVELVEPLEFRSGVGRFLDKRGEGLHHLCFEVDDVGAVIRALDHRGVPLIDRRPRPGLAGQIAFLHPSACDGVLVELATPPPGAASLPAWLRFKRLVIGAEDPGQTARVFQSLFGLSEVVMNEGPRAMLSVGGGALLIVPADEVGGATGMVALSLIAEDFPAVTAALDRAGVVAREGSGELTVEPASSFGVHLHVSRYE
jgi:methylmalonyl-CoA epimerase